MIDIETQIFSPIADRVRGEFPGTSVSSAYVHAPKSFPHASLVEQDNFPTRERLDSSDQERYATLMYQVDVYSDKASGKKAQCRAIMAVIDQELYRRNFVRLSMAFAPNLEDQNISRLTARYRVETDGKTLFRR